jgi:hypothetical protein
MLAIRTVSYYNGFKNNQGSGMLKAFEKLLFILLPNIFLSRDLCSMNLLKVG